MHHYIELVWYKACADLRAEAARAYLGALWWILEPLLYMLAFYLVFGVLLQRGGGSFVSFLLCGLVIWRWFATSVTRGTTAITANSGLMSQVYLPKYLFPMIVLVTNTIKFLIVFFLLLSYLVLVDGRGDLSWLALPILIFVQFLLNAACASIVAAVVPFVPDLRIAIANALTLLLFLSGIFYDIGTFPDEVQSYFRLNPIATLIENYRLVLLYGELPRWLDLGAMTLISGLGIWFAASLLVRYDRYYPRIVYS